MSATQQFQIFKCDLCGQVIEVLHAGSPSLVCCGQPMKLMVEGASDGAKEKHVPVLEKTEKGGTRVKVGSVPHPMTPEHYIEWIEIVCKRGYRHMPQRISQPAGDAVQIGKVKLPCQHIDNNPHPDKGWQEYFPYAETLGFFHLQACMILSYAAF